MEDNKSLAVEEAEVDLRELAQKSDLVFVGTVRSVGRAPIDWSGYGNTYQTVQYKVERVFKGENTQAEISIDHVVVYGSKTAQPGDTPGLSTDLFAPNAKLLVSARKSQSGAYKSLSDNYGAMPATETLLKKMEAALRSGR